MSRNVILRTQANEVFRILSVYGLPLSDFQWAEIASRTTSNLVVSELVHRPTGYFFTFDFDLDGRPRTRGCTYSPGRGASVEEERASDWEDLTYILHGWAENLRRELSEPDLWATVAQEKQLVGAADAVESNAPFSASEQQQIASSINEIREFLTTSLRLSEERYNIASTRLDYLEAASQRIGRKDWLILASGQVLSIIVAAALPSEEARELLRFVGFALHWLIQHRDLLPGL